MVSVSAALQIGDAGRMEWPQPSDVVREYFRRRVDELTRAVAAKLMGTTAKNVDHLKRGRGKISWTQVAKVTDEDRAQDLFAALAGVAAELAAKGLDADAAALEAGKKKQRASARPAPDPKAKEGAALPIRPSTQSRGKQRRPPSESDQPKDDR